MSNIISALGQLVGYAVVFVGAIINFLISIAVAVINYVIASRRAIFGFVVAWVAFVVIGAGLTTQFVMARLIDMGVSVPFGLRLATTGQDIVGMAPLFGTIFGAFLLVAMVAAHIFSRIIRYRPEVTFATAGFMAIILGLALLEAMFNITAIAATRTLAGTVSLAIVGALAGFLHYTIARKPTP